MTVRYDTYLIQCVYQRMTPQLRDQLVGFWLQHGALSDEREAYRRTDEVVCMAYSDGGTLVGVNTAYLSTLPNPPRRVYLYRMFMRSTDRHLGLSKTMARTAVEVLRRAAPAEEAVVGVAYTTENPKLMQAGAHRGMARMGWCAAGRNSQGQEIWLYLF